MTQSTVTKLRDGCRKLCTFQQECQQLPVALLPHTPEHGSRFLNELRHQGRCYDNNRQPGEGFLTGSLSRWQWFGPWPEAMYSDRVTICWCHRTSLAQLTATRLLSLRTESHCQAVWCVSSCNLLASIWEIIHCVHCSVPLNSSYTCFNICFYLSHLPFRRQVFSLDKYMNSWC